MNKIKYLHEYIMSILAKQSCYLLEWVAINSKTYL